MIEAVRPGFLGVLMLDTRFPRPLGDIGHPDSFGIPVRQEVVSGAWPDKVVASAAALRASGLLNTFCAHAIALEREGAKAITTSCGFLVLLQRELQDAVAIPVVTSSLLQLPELLDAAVAGGGADHQRGGTWAQSTCWRRALRRSVWAM